jgi:hypothetical protein
MLPDTHNIQTHQTQRQAREQAAEENEDDYDANVPRE